MRGVELIAAERQRQIVAEGYFPEGDAGRAPELIFAAIAYGLIGDLEVEDLAAGNPITPENLSSIPPWWPWGRDAWKPTGDPVRDLTKAGALIAAALDTLIADGATVTGFSAESALGFPHKSPSPLAGEQVFVHLVGGEAVEEFIVEDWWDRVSGHSWQESIGNPAAVTYSIRASFVGLPIDDNVLYGKVGGLGRLVHVSEVVRREVVADGKAEAA